MLGNRLPAWGHTVALVALLLPGLAGDAVLAAAFAQSGPLITAEETTPGSGLVDLAEMPDPLGTPLNAEFIYLSGYEPDGARGVQVLLDRPGKTVVLILSSYEPTSWELDATPGTTVAQVLIGGDDSTLKTELSLEAYRADIDHAYDVQNRRFGDALSKLQKVYGIDRIDYFFGQYRLPATIEVRDIGDPDPRLTVAWPPVEEPLETLRFFLPRPDLTRGLWSVTGPLDERDAEILAPEFVALSPDGRTAYRIGDDAIEIIDVLYGGIRTVPLPNNFERFSWPEGIAYDIKNDIVGIATSGGSGAGAFYRFDAIAERWRDFRSLSRSKNLDSLSYDRATGQYVAAAQGDPGLHFLSEEGDYVETVELGDRVPGLLRTFDRNNESVPSLSIVPLRNYIAIILTHPPPYFTRMDESRSVLRIWLYETRSGTARLTYRQGCSDILSADTSWWSIYECPGGL